MAIDVVADKILIGHHTARSGYVIDASASRSLSPGVDYTLTVTLKGSTVSVMVNSAFGASHAFNAVGVDGRFGLLARAGDASFDEVRIKTDDAAFRTDGSALLAAAPATTTDTVAPLSDADVQGMVAAATQRLALDAVQLATLGALTVRVVDLPGQQLGVYRDGEILIDVDAAGYGWFIDATPGDDAEFVSRRDGGLMAVQGQAAGRIDLLSALAHEVGHALGALHSDDGVMTAWLDAGVRTLTAAEPVWPTTAGPALSHYWEPSTLLPPAARNPQDERDASPVIDWSYGQTREAGKLAGTAVRHAWVTDFVNHLARSGDAQRNPNAALRLHADVAPRLTEDLSRLARS